EGGSCRPRTCEKPTPPRSSSVASSMMRVSPPPPSAASPGFSQASALKALPSSVSRCTTMRSCKASRYSRTLCESTNSIKRTAPRSSHVLAHEVEHVRVPRDDVVRLENPVVLVGKDQQLARYCVVLERFEQHQPFADGTAIVEFAVDDQRR